MTHKDIYTKFMIEYDKAGATTSYPSLTEYEVATVLDKAYNALIAQKVTGNNYRRATFESDLKSIADLGPLTRSKSISMSDDNLFASNVLKGEVPKDLLYFLLALMTMSNPSSYTSFLNTNGEYNPADGKAKRTLPIKLVNHEIASRFFSSISNMPWVKQPVCFIEDRDVYVVYDPLNPPSKQNFLPFYETDSAEPHAGSSDFPTLDNTSILVSSIDAQNIAEYVRYNTRLNKFVVMYQVGSTPVVYKDAEFQTPTGESIWFSDMHYNDGSYDLFYKTQDSRYYALTDGTLSAVDSSAAHNSDYNATVTYIKRPMTFVKDLPELSDQSQYITYFDYSPELGDSEWDGDDEWNDQETLYKDRYEFECNSTVAEELISLAVTFALENVESLRLNSKLNMRGLEA